ncbi:MAG: hypothetical protein N5P05_000819 [Chroococcopsis gigantea SAG 12.99]|jgi:hypothetical protein|nr:hypothetical protein [Chroococcopsis gigantea SAG 12.99]
MTTFKLTKKKRNCQPQEKLGWGKPKRQNSMNRSGHYQPLILRILHGVIAIVGMLAIITAFWVYNTYDGRIGQRRMV